MLVCMLSSKCRVGRRRMVVKKAADGRVEKQRRAGLVTREVAT